jgi:hypothetical protein
MQKRHTSVLEMEMSIEVASDCGRINLRAYDFGSVTASVRILRSCTQRAQSADLCLNYMALMDRYLRYSVSFQQCCCFQQGWSELSQQLVYESSFMLVLLLDPDSLIYIGHSLCQRVIICNIPGGDLKGPSSWLTHRMTCLDVS